MIGNVFWAAVSLLGFLLLWFTGWGLANAFARMDFPSWNDDLHEELRKEAEEAGEDNRRRWRELHLR